MTVLRCPISPFDDQKPGTSGLRRPTRVFSSPGYLESFLQAIFNADPPPPGAALVVGGDGRYFADTAAETTARMALANGYARVIIGRGGLMSTPAVSALIRRRGAWGGVILSASHNAGGVDGDFGVKYNTASGGPASQDLGDEIHRRTLALSEYRILSGPAVDLDRVGAQDLGPGAVEIVDPTTDYLTTLEPLFDLPAIAALLRGGFRFRFDAMNAVTGPYAHALFEDRLGAPRGTVMRGRPLPDFGGEPPDPHLDHLSELAAEMFGAAPADMAAASDGDGDRNMILGPGLVVSPGDSLAVIAANAHLLPAFAGGGAFGVARSMPTSRALDRVAEALGLELHETPTGWKWFSSLLDAGAIRLCGEESFGTGSDHIREKDGLWAVLCWLNILAVRHTSVGELLAGHWARFGRDYYQRCDFEGLDAEVAARLMSDLKTLSAGEANALGAGLTIRSIESLSYRDPVNGSSATDQGIRLSVGDRGRITYRLSGTGSEGAALRVYLEQYAGPDEALHDDPQQVLAPLLAAAQTIAGIPARTGLSAPTAIS
jgi:phosphoglucomutase